MSLILQNWVLLAINSDLLTPLASSPVDIGTP